MKVIYGSSGTWNSSQVCISLLMTCSIVAFSVLLDLLFAVYLLLILFCSSSFEGTNAGMQAYVISDKHCGNLLACHSGR